MLAHNFVDIKIFSFFCLEKFYRLQTEIKNSIIIIYIKSYKKI